jgi:CelD/BcsL family acetyltransferase involved in cellulose biosynthesis
MSPPIAELDPPHVKSSSTRVACRVVQTDAELADLQPAWEAIDGSLTSPMETFGWSAAAHATREQRTALIVAEQDGSLRSIAELARCGRWLRSRCEMLGMTRLNEPADFISVDSAGLAAVIDRAIAFGRPILLGRLPAESPTIGEFERLARGHGKVLVRPRASCPYIPLDATWLQPEGHLTSRRRSDFRRASRRAEQEGPIKAEILAPRPEAVAGLLETAYAIEAKSWKGSEGTALASDQIHGQFMRRFADWASRAGILRIALLRIGDNYAAMQIAAEHNRAFWLLKIGFDPEFASCSPGNLLLAESLRYSAQQGLSSLEFLGTVEPWTQVWTDHERKCVSLRYYPFNLGGALALAVEATALVARRVGERWARRRQRESSDRSS